MLRWVYFGTTRAAWWAAEWPAITFAVAACVRLGSTGSKVFLACTMVASAALHIAAMIVTEARHARAAAGTLRRLSDHYQIIVGNDTSRLIAEGSCQDVALFIKVVERMLGRWAARSRVHRELRPINLVTLRPRTDTAPLEGQYLSFPSVMGPSVLVSHHEIGEAAAFPRFLLFHELGHLGYCGVMRLSRILASPVAGVVFVLVSSSIPHPSPVYYLIAAYAVGLTIRVFYPSDVGVEVEADMRAARCLLRTPSGRNDLGVVVSGFAQRLKWLESRATQGDWRRRLSYGEWWERHRRLTGCLGRDPDKMPLWLPTGPELLVPAAIAAIAGFYVEAIGTLPFAIVIVALLVAIALWYVGLVMLLDGFRQVGEALGYRLNR
jgi:hypothetical protein